jgi:putative PIN family toxin of toxin-antitoxin system
VLVDTNVIVSALLFPGSVPERALSHIIEQESLVLTTWIIDELQEVIKRKWPDRLPALDTFLGADGYELLGAGNPAVQIRDPRDQPILDAAITGAVDLIVTGDKDFLALTMNHPLVWTPRQYVDSV